MFPARCPICSHDSLIYETDKVACNVCSYSDPLKWYKRPFSWARGKTWWWRVLILLWMLYIFSRYIKDYEYPMQRIANIFNAIDFGMHELGHIIFIPLGEFMTILGGSLTQILFPLIWLGALYWKRWYFAASLCFIWVGYNFFDVATYVADARVRLLPLATMSDDYDSAHDWYQLLSRMNKLDSDLAIARTMRITGVIFVLVGTILATTLIVLMVLLKKHEPKTPEDPKEDLKGKPASELYPTPTRN